MLSGGTQRHSFDRPSFSFPREGVEPTTRCVYRSTLEPPRHDTYKRLYPSFNTLRIEPTNTKNNNTRRRDIFSHSLYLIMRSKSQLMAFKMMGVHDLLASGSTLSDCQFTTVFTIRSVCNNASVWFFRWLLWLDVLFFFKLHAVSRK